MIVFKVMRKGVEYKAMIDEVDADLLTQRWAVRVQKDRNAKYLIRTNHKILPRNVLLHRVIMERALGREMIKGEFVDHIDMNGLNNTRSNLRIASNRQNRTNTPALKSNTSGFKGVIKAWRRWRAVITVNGKHIHLGMFDTAEEAHAAYCEAAKKYNGEFARGK